MFCTRSLKIFSINNDGTVPPRHCPAQAMSKQGVVHYWHWPTRFAISTQWRLKRSMPIFTKIPSSMVTAFYIGKNLYIMLTVGSYIGEHEKTYGHRRTIRFFVVKIMSQPSCNKKVKYINKVDCYLYICIVSILYQ